ncbi:nineteen complex-related protein 2-domain-containing protein [Gautieria morchelliformis]|nr:nineteen complex-related protein 2-domain-containing protein [Gautieria morchelliformis]
MSCESTYYSNNEEQGAEDQRDKSPALLVPAATTSNSIAEPGHVWLFANLFMSGDPQIIKRVRSRAARIRDTSPTDPADDSPSTTPDTLATKLKNKQKRSKPKSRLSFGTDDQVSDGEVFKVRKSNLSRKLVLGSAPSTPGVSAPTNLDQASISTAPSYTKAYLSELKANTPSTPPVRPPIPENNSDTSFDVSFDIDGAVVENASDVFGETAIPSASAISAAKEKRGRLRGTGADDEFISLSVAKPGDVPQGPHPESRLVREEDELGEGEDDMAEYTGAQERIALGKKARKDEERKRRMGMVEMIEDAEEEDEETIEWEKAQIRRAGPVDNDRGENLKPRKETYTPAPIPSVTPIPTLASSVGRLSDSLTALMSSHTSHTVALSTLAQERTALESKEAEMRQMVEKAERKRSWFAAFRGWVEGSRRFQYPLLEKLEDEHVSLLTERYDMISKRRRIDDEDDVALFLGVPPSISPSDSVEETDELGRVVPSQNTTSALRASRRLARSNRRLLRRAQNQAVQEDEGYSTDGSLPSADANDFRTAMTKLDERKVSVLSDVRADEFRDPQMGLAKWFGAWRELYEESYVGAWGGLGLVAAWEFWCRLEIVGWDPIDDTSQSLDSFEWSAALHDYSRPRKSSDVEKEDDDIEPDIGPGGDMVSSMISQAIIPRLSKVIEGGAFDPYSARHIRRMIDIAEQVEAYVEQEGVRFQALLKSVSTVFREAVISTQTLLAPSLGPSNPGAPFDPYSLPARRRFLVRRLKLLTNILKWRKYTGERFGLGEVATLLVRSCILPVAERGWEVGGEEILRKTVDKMPLELVPIEVKRKMA